MTLRFGTITEFSGPYRQVKTHLLSQEDTRMDVRPAWSGGPYPEPIRDFVIPGQGSGERAVMLEGKDTDRFLKEAYGIEYPTELKGLDREGFFQKLYADVAFPENQDAFVGLPPSAKTGKYAALIEKIDAMSSDVYSMYDKVLAYVDARKAEGKDTEGNPIRQQAIQ